ncbi:SKI family transcriptional corepressor 1-like, partial [Varroa jacobsoni]|uniref:SKI family transcriptional corepressor 1-like n=1 Tax=Varroa jacobsoni TaxID=62625 RepID=UPI000BF777AA
HNNNNNNSSNNGTNNAATSGHPSEVRTVVLFGVPIVALLIDSQERLSLAQISNTLLKDFSYNEIHNRRVALGITCVQCTPVQLELLRRAGAMPVSSRRCGMITKREAERLCKSFLTESTPPKLPDNFSFDVVHACAWGCRGSFVPSRYNSSRAKCIKCALCGLFFSPNKFIFHSHRLPDSKYVQPDAANFNSWRRHIRLAGNPPEDVLYAWEDVKAMFNGGSRKRVIVSSSSSAAPSSSSGSQNGPGGGGSAGAPPAAKKAKASTTTAVAADYPALSPLPLGQIGVGGGLGGLGAKVGPGGYFASMITSLNLSPPTTGDHEAPFPVPPVPPLFCLPGGSPTKTTPGNTAVGLNPFADYMLMRQFPLWSPPLASSVNCAVSLGNAGGLSLPSSDSPSASPPSTMYPSAFKPVTGPPPCSNARHSPPSLASSSPPCDTTTARSPTGHGGGGGGGGGAREDESEERDDVDDGKDLDDDADELDVDGMEGPDLSDPRPRGFVAAADNHDSVEGARAGDSRDHRHHHGVKEIDDNDEDVEVGEETPPLKSQPPDSGNTTTSLVTATTTTTITEARFKKNTPLGFDELKNNRDETSDGPTSPKQLYHMTKEELRDAVRREAERRRRAEREFGNVRESLQAQMRKEAEYREELASQLQLVRDAFYQELDQERKARITVQQKLKEAHDALQQLRADYKGVDYSPARSSELVKQIIP